MITLIKEKFGDRLGDRIRARKPFSLIRFGDGEATIMRYPRYATLAQARTQVARWWREPEADKQQISCIRAPLLLAIQHADMLGVPSVAEQRLYPKWNVGLRYEAFMRGLNLPKAGADVFYFYHVVAIDRNGTLDDVLHNDPSIRLITCRPQALKIAQRRFGTRRIEMRLVRAETFRWRPYSEIDAAAKLCANCPPHWPEGYREVCAWIRAGGAGHVYLVGAGGLGKIYCDLARRAGSIGLDLGALFDGWVGLQTRPYLRGRSA